MLLVLRKGSRFFTFQPPTYPTLPGMQFTLPVSRSPSERGFMIIIRSQTNLLLCVNVSSLPSSWVQFFFLNFFSLFTACHSCSFFSALVPGSLPLFWSIKFSAFFLGASSFFACLEFVFYEFSQAKLLASITPCGAQRVSVHVQHAACALGCFYSPPAWPKSLLELSFSF